MASIDMETQPAAAFTISVTKVGVKFLYSCLNFRTFPSKFSLTSIVRPRSPNPTPNLYTGTTDYPNPTISDHFTLNRQLKIHSFRRPCSKSRCQDAMTKIWLKKKKRKRRSKSPSK